MIKWKNYVTWGTTQGNGDDENQEEEMSWRKWNSRSIIPECPLKDRLHILCVAGKAELGKCIQIREMPVGAQYKKDFLKSRHPIFS